MVDKEDTRQLPAIHEAARLWFSSDAKTLEACVRYLRALKPGWSLNWLREAAAKIINNELHEAALRAAVEQNVPERARDSVWSAVCLLVAFTKEGAWRGIPLPHHDVPVGRDLTVRVRPVGMFYSPVKNERRLIGLQPRQDFAPTHLQDQIWMSALYYEFCCDPLEPLDPLILDLSRPSVAAARCLTELTSAQLAILSKDELDARLDRVARCFEAAREVVPPPAPRARKAKPTGQIELFDPDADP